MPRRILGGPGAARGALALGSYGHGWQQVTLAGKRLGETAVVPVYVGSCLEPALVIEMGCKIGHVNRYVPVQVFPVQPLGSFQDFGNP